jgi:hypothetical protein
LVFRRRVEGMIKKAGGGISVSYRADRETAGILLNALTAQRSSAVQAACEFPSVGEQDTLLRQNCKDYCI